VFPEAAILTLHNSELEVLPQPAHRLPRGSEAVMALGGQLALPTSQSKPSGHGVLAVATSSRSDTSARSRRGHLHLISAHNSELLLVSKQCPSMFSK